MSGTIQPIQAHEAPLIRVRVRTAQGVTHQITISATFRLSAEALASASYRAELARAVEGFLGGRGLTVLSVEHIATLSVEVH